MSNHDWMMFDLGSACTFAAVFLGRLLAPVRVLVRNKRQPVVTITTGSTFGFRPGAIITGQNGELLRIKKIGSTWLICRMVPWEQRLWLAVTKRRPR